MLSEGGKVVYRRFSGRLVESGLLILAVALGVGVASSGFSLLGNTIKAGKEMLASPAYRELVVSARSNAEEMTVPAAKKPAASNVALTSSDLDAASLAPAIAYAYVQNRDDLQFINAASVKQEAAMAASFGAPGANVAVAAPAADAAGAADGGATPSAAAGQGTAARTRRAAGDNGPPGFQRMSEDDLKKAQAQADLVIVDGMERLNGFRVTPPFFEAWRMKASFGSLLTDSDAQGDATAIVLGSSAAAKIAGSGKSPSDLIGKKLLTRDGNMQIVGILAPTGTSSYDESFFSPYKTYASSAQGNGPPRMWTFNTQLRFTVSDASKLGETEKLLTGWFESRFGEGQIAISNPRSEAQKLIDRNQGIGLLILFLSLSGLFIALVNVSHILMSRGLRMRKGVGIMMALGASRYSVLGLFASEATAVSVAGSLLGGAFALPISRSMQSALGLSGGSWLFVILGVLASWLLTLAFSVAPAWQNSRIVPAEAMRAA
jgi:ABC-type lipoprotein release transport system permease subunit